MQYGQYPAPRFTVAHLSDVHLLAHGVRQYGVIEPEDGLQLALERLRRLERVPDALVFTGDLADKAEPEAYARLRELVEPVAAETGRPGGVGDGQPRRAGRRSHAGCSTPTTTPRRTGSTTWAGCGSWRSTPACRTTTTAS